MARRRAALECSKPPTANAKEKPAVPNRKFMLRRRRRLPALGGAGCAMTLPIAAGRGAASREPRAAPAAPPAAATAAAPTARASHIEGRIAYLKAELKITPAQEAQWDKVAQAMRQNATERRQGFEQVQQRPHHAAQRAAAAREPGAVLGDARAAGRPLPRRLPAAL